MRNPDFYPIEEDFYCYPGTSILQNIPNIHDAHKLERYEFVSTEARTPEAIGFCQNSIDLCLWQNIHRILFQDVYAWAGELRTIRLSKGDSVFAYPEYIEAAGAKVFKNLAEERLIKDRLCERLAFYYNELNVLHPFREGNGRTQRLLFKEIAQRQGFKLDWAKTIEGDHLQAVIQAYEGNLSPLEQLFEKILTPI